MVNPQGNEIAQNTKYEELIKLWHLYKLKIRSKRTSSDNSKIEKGLTTTPPEHGAYDHVSYANMIYVMMCNHMI